ncbi:MAG: hypothetical protein RLZZ618_4201 [Pseudomonadota bacterium]|jgi:hypothetical protein
MISFLRRAFAAFVLLVGAMGIAHAQRAGVPLMDFKDIPVSLSSQKAVSAEAVRQAFQASAVAERWDVASLPDGSLQLSTLRNGKHTVVLAVTYDAEKYSVVYERSEQLNYAEAPPPLRAIGPSRTVESSYAMDEAARKQAARFAHLPEAKFSVRHGSAMIHPSYESWIHELLGGVRRRLMLP